MEEVIDEIVNIIQEFKSKRYLEIEFRLGISRDYFNTKIKKEQFQNIKKVLDTMELESEPEISSEKVEYDNTDRRRTDNNIIISKKILEKIDYIIENSPFDMRLSIAQEQPVSKFDEDSISRTVTKNRTSYKYSIWSYDLTEIILENGLLEYSIEIELDHKKIKDLKTTVHSSLLKVIDLCRICEPESIPGSFINTKKN